MPLRHVVDCFEGQANQNFFGNPLSKIFREREGALTSQVMPFYRLDQLHHHAWTMHDACYGNWAEK